MTAPMSSKAAQPSMVDVLAGFIITLLLTQASIWVPLFLLERQNIINNHLTWIQCALISITWSVTRMWWMNLRKSHDHVPTHRINSH